MYWKPSGMRTTRQRRPVHAPTLRQPGQRRRGCRKIADRQCIGERPSRWPGGGDELARLAQTAEHEWMSYECGQS